MKRFCSIINLLALLATGFINPVFSKTLSQDKDFTEFEKTVLAEMREKNVPGAAIAIVSGEKIIFIKGFGLANVETNLPVTPETLFQTGSITKTFTAALVLGLAEEAKIKLDVPIGNYAKNLNSKIASVSLHHLLSHTAGILDEPDEYGGQDETMMASYLRSWKDDYCLFDAGETFSYSNSGFALAGFTAQEAAGKPYTTLMTERVFTPLGMTRTTFQPTIAMTYPLAVGHKAPPGEKPFVVRPLPQDARLYPAGTMYTNANEMARFALAFLNKGNLEGKRVLSPSIIAQMQTPRAKQLSVPDDTSYGYGLFMRKYRGVQTVWHDGSMTGYSASMLMAPEHRFAAIILTNANGVVLNKTQEAAKELLLPLAQKETLKPFAALTMTDSEMKKYVGIYSQPNRFKIEIMMKEGKLFIKEFDIEMPLTKIGENRFSFQLPRANKPLEIYIGLDKAGQPVFLHQYVWAFKRLEN